MISHHIFLSESKNKNKKNYQNKEKEKRREKKQKGKMSKFTPESFNNDRYKDNVLTFEQSNYYRI